MKQIPALTSIGGTTRYDSKEILEYRVWVHPKAGGDDYYYRAETWTEIVDIGKSVQHEGYVELPLGVIKDDKSPHGYREVKLTGIPGLEGEDLE